MYYRNDQRAQSEKVTPRGIRGRFVGFAEGSNGSIIKVWKEGTRQVTEERNFEPVEDSEPYDGHQTESTKDEDDLDFGPGVLSVGIRNQLGRPQPSSNLNHTPPAMDQIMQHGAQEPIVATTEQNSPRERELDQPHELSPALEPCEPSSTPLEGEVNAQSCRERTQSVIDVRPPLTIENDRREVQHSTNPETELEEPLIRNL